MIFKQQERLLKKLNLKEPTKTPSNTQYKFHPIQDRFNQAYFQPNTQINNQPHQFQYLINKTITTEDMRKLCWTN